MHACLGLLSALWCFGCKSLWVDLQVTRVPSQTWPGCGAAVAPPLCLVPKGFSPEPPWMPQMQPFLQNTMAMAWGPWPLGHAWTPNPSLDERSRLSFGGGPSPQCSVPLGHLVLANVMIQKKASHEPAEPTVWGRLPSSGKDGGQRSQG